MAHYKYLIVGGGMAAHAAVRGIRSVDRDGSIGLISAESDPPYKRPPLTKDLWKGKKTEAIWYDTANHGADLHLGRAARAIKAVLKRVSDDQGNEYTYERLLLANGGSPKRLPYGNGVNYFRTFQDYQRLRADVEKGRRFAVIGGGFIGSEIAAALAINEKEPIMIFPDKGISSRIFPEDLSRFVTEYYEQKRVEIISETEVKDMDQRGDQFSVSIRDKNRRKERSLIVDGVVAGIGIAPDVGLAREAGLAVDDGVIVDEFTRTTDPDIFAAGDVAAFINPALDKRLRVEHEDNAKTMGMVAGKNMAGDATHYDHLPFFYSDLFDLGYEAVGELDSRLETVSDWKDPYKEGVVYYLRDGRVRGVLFWNVWKQLDAARRLIAEPGPFTAKDLRRRLPEG